VIAQCLTLSSRITQAILRSPCAFAPSILVAKAQANSIGRAMASPMLPSLDTLAAMASAAAAEAAATVQERDRDLTVSNGH